MGAASPVKRLKSFLFCLLLWPGAVLADLDRPDTLDETMQWMADAFEATEDVTSVEIDTANERLLLRIDAEEEPLISYPHNLHQLLGNAETGQERQEFFDFHVLAILETLQAGDMALTVQNLSRIYPVIRHVSMRHNTDLLEPDNEYARGGTMGDTDILYVIDDEMSVKYLMTHDMATLGLTNRKLQEIARGNLALKLENITVEGDGLYMLVLDGFYESSAVTYAPFWEDMSTYMDRVLMAVPARDLVVFADGANPQAERVLRDVIRDFSTKSAYPVSEQLYLWDDGEWETLP